MFVRPTRWAEVGTWRFVRASLTLDIAPAPGGCEVRYRFRITGPGPVRVLGLAASAVSLPAVRADLRKAATLVG